MSGQLYTSSRLRVWRQCNRAHFYRYTLAIRTPSTPAMSFGTNAHKALEAWYRAWQLGCATCEGSGERPFADTTQGSAPACSMCGGTGWNPDGRLKAAFAVIDALDDCDEIDRVRLRVLVAAYDARWGAEDWEVLGVEIQFRYFLGDIEIGGKIDALIRERATGRVFVVEHKTSSADTSPGSLYWDRLAIDTQVSIYVDGAAFGLDYEIAGCVYDVLKRPQHELKLATPEDARKYTLGKGCKECGGSAGGKRGVVRGSGVVAYPIGDGKCEACAGTGWKLDDKGDPEAPRLHANQRDADETIEEYSERLTNEVAERVDEYLARSIVVRLDSELPRMRQELIDTISAMRALENHTVTDEHGKRHPAPLYPPNHDACVRGRDACAFFAACTGRADINDEHVFPRGEAHPELASAA